MRYNQRQARFGKTYRTRTLRPWTNEWWQQHQQALRKVAEALAAFQEGVRVALRSEAFLTALHQVEDKLKATQDTVLKLDTTPMTGPFDLVRPPLQLTRKVSTSDE